MQEKRIARCLWTPEDGCPYEVLRSVGVPSTNAKISPVSLRTPKGCGNLRGIFPQNYMCNTLCDQVLNALAAKW